MWGPLGAGLGPEKGQEHFYMKLHGDVWWIQRSFLSVLQSFKAGTDNNK